MRIFGIKKKPENKLKISEAIINALKSGGDKVILIGTANGTRVIVLGKNTVREQIERILTEKGF